MVAVAFIAFLLFQYVGDPVVFLLGQDAKPEQIRELRAALGLDKPFFVQFWHFLVNAAQGEFGLSLRQGAKVSRLIGERFPATLELALVAAVLALVIGIPMGVYTALRRGTFMSQVFMTVSLLGVSLPTFLIGILLILRVRGARWAGSRASGAARRCSWAGGRSGLLQCRWLEAHRAAGGHAGDLPAHADHAAGARRDARGAAHRLHQVRARGACRTAPSISAMRSRTRWCR